LGLGGAQDLVELRLARQDVGARRAPGQVRTGRGALLGRELAMQDREPRLVGKMVHHLASPCSLSFFFPFFSSLSSSASALRSLARTSQTIWRTRCVLRPTRRATSSWRGDGSS